MKTLTFELPNDRDVGEVAIRPGQMEYELKMLVKSLCGITVGVALDATERKMAREVRELIVKLAKRRFGTSPALARPEAFLQRSREASDRRNDLLHGLWATDEDGAPVHRSSGRGNRKGPFLLADDQRCLVLALHLDAVGLFIGGNEAVQGLRVGDRLVGDDEGLPLAAEHGDEGLGVLGARRRDQRVECLGGGLVGELRGRGGEAQRCCRDHGERAQEPPTRRRCRHHRRRPPPRDPPQR